MEGVEANAESKPTMEDLPRLGVPSVIAVSIPPPVHPTPVPTPAAPTEAPADVVVSEEDTTDIQISLQDETKKQQSNRATSTDQFTKKELMAMNKAKLEAVCESLSIVYCAPKKHAVEKILEAQSTK